MPSAGSTGLPRLGFARICKRMRLAERARENALRELPATTDEQLDETQQQVVEQVRAEVGRVCAAYDASLVELNRRIRELDVGRRLRALRRAPTELTRQLRELAARVELGLVRAAGEYESVAAEYAAFRARHHLEREPRYPASQLGPVMLLLAAAVAEAALAAHVFGPDRVTAAQAVGVSFVDVLVAFQLGRVVPWVAARTWRHRLAGAAAILLLFAWVGGMNLLAHLSGIAVEHAWILAGIGCAFSLSGAAIGLFSDDRYPGYGALDRRLARARAERDYWKSTWLDGASALHERQQASINTARRGVDEDVAALEKVVDAKARLLDEIRDFGRNTENAANALLRLYRDTNAGHRTTPPPAYFEKTWRLNLPDHLADSVDDDRRRLEQARGAIDCAERMAIDARESAREVYRQFVLQCAAAAKPSLRKADADR